MTERDIQQYLKKRDLSSASAPMNLAFCHSWMVGFMRMRKHFREYYQEIITIVKDGIGYQWNDKKQNFRNLEQLYEDQIATRKLMKQWAKQRDAFFQHWNRELRLLPKWNGTELCKRYRHYLDEVEDLWAAPLAVDLMGVYTENVLYPEFIETIPKKYKSRASEIFSELCKPIKPSFVAEEHLSLLQLTIAFKRKSPLFMDMLHHHQKRFFWIENNYKDVRTLSQEYFLQKVKKKLAKP